MTLCGFNCGACPFAYICIPMAVGAVIVWKQYAESAMQKKRFASQVSFLFISNLAFLVGSTGLIYTYFYCWEAPLAAMACPIGILEHAAIDLNLTLGVYLAGFVGLVSVVFGRAACGWACPIGFLQDMIGVKDTVKSRLARRIDRHGRWLKWIILAAIAPISYVTGLMAFTEICPIGGLTATYPTLALDPSAYTYSAFFYPKMLALAGFFILAVLLIRGWCRHLCPIGAMMAPFNHVSLLQLRVDHDNCIHCGRCADICPMDVDMPEHPASAECVRCGRCVEVCPVDVITLGFT